MSETNETSPKSIERTYSSRTGLGLVGIALILPVLSGAVLFFVTSFWLVLGISAATVIASGAFVAIDARRLGNVDLEGRVRESAGFLFVGMCLLWIVVFPIAFFRRRHFGGPNLGFLSVVVAAFFVGGPFLYSVLIPPRLPSCRSLEVAKLLEQVIRSTTVGATTKSIDGHRELSCDPDVNVRQGECVAHTDAGDIQVKFVVEWQDRNKGLFQVRIPPAGLPSCTSPEVVKLLEQVIRSTPAGATTKSVDSHRELSYDPDANVRQGECVAHTDAGDIQVKFVVEWRDRNKGLFQVQIPPAGLPSCTSPEVVKLLEQVIRSTPAGATTKSIDGHRELSCDPDVNVRQGECVAHTDADDIQVKFVVEWQDRNKGLFQVRIVTE